MKELEELREYLEVYIDMRSSQLQDGGWGPIPDFQYYKENVIEDRGGCYDFTSTRYKTPVSEVKVPTFMAHKHRSMPVNEVVVWTEYSSFKGIIFNKKVCTREEFGWRFIKVEEKIKQEDDQKSSLRAFLKTVSNG